MREESRRKRIIIALLAGAIFLSANASSGQRMEAQHSSKSGAGTVRFDELRRQGLEATHNLDYESARHSFEEIARLYPEHPAGPLLLASYVWLKTLNESRRLQSSFYNSDSFYIESNEKVDPRATAQFREYIRLAKELAEARLQSNPKDVEALYFLGYVEGIKAAFTASVERKFIAALRAGFNGVAHHRQVLKLDPAFLDAELTIGVYDYVVGDLPLPIKVLASLGGMRGSKKRGIERIERVAKESEWTGDNAKVVLIAVMKRERRFEEAHTIAQELARKYPRNYLFKIETADALVLLAAHKRKTDAAAAARAGRESIAIFDALLRDPAVRRVAPSLDLVHFRYGEALLAAGQPESAATQFLLSARATKAQDQLVTLAHLRAAQALDLASKREEALAQYHIVVKRPSVFDSRTEAARGLREPYKR